MKIALSSLGLMQAAFFCTWWSVVSASAQAGEKEDRSIPILDKQDIFVEVAAEVGLDFVHFNGMTGKYHIPESQSGGGAMFDYDNDGDLDLFLVQGAIQVKGEAVKNALFPPKHPLPLSDRLYRNDMVILPDGTRELKFTDVTKESGLSGSHGYGIGVAAADYDNDGWIDLYVLNIRENQMWRNNGDGTFSDVTQKTNTVEPRWSASASFFDFNRDGHLDLYVANYIQYDFKNYKRCVTTRGNLDYCGPNSYKDEYHRLFQNMGDGTFTDITVKSGINTEHGAGLGVVAADLNGDNWLDIYVANDADPNFMWINKTNGTFVNDALFAGCALNANGAAEAGMGVDAGDFDGDGDLDLFMTHLTGETHTLYRNDGTGLFEDVTDRFGLGAATLEANGFGTAWFDYDNDGWLDLFVANGLIRADDRQVQAKVPYPFNQPNQLFRNEGGKRFIDISMEAGDAVTRSLVSRAAAFGDIDNDGDTDILVVNNNGPADLLINTVGNQKNWLGIRLTYPNPTRDALGTRLVLTTGKDKSLTRMVRADASFAAANDPRVIFGLNDEKAVKILQANWPDGTSESWEITEVNTYITLVKGTGSSR